MNPVNRLGLFALVFVALVAIGSKPQYGMHLSKSLNDMCVCVPARAGLMAKAAKAHARSMKLLALQVTTGQ